MLDVVYEIEVIMMWSDLIISRFDNEQIDRTSIHENGSNLSNWETTKSIPWTASTMISVQLLNFKDGGS